MLQKEGINGTVSGLKDDVNAYMDFVRSDNDFKDTVFKIDEAEGHAFNKLIVRVKKN